MKIRISYKSFTQLFHPCNEDFIRNVCHGYCCEMHSGDGETHIPINSTDINNFKSVYPNVKIKNGLIETGKRCLFKTDVGFCSLHNKPEYPFPCRVVPFCLNKNNVLIIRNRWRLLKCFRVNKGKVPAYKAFQFNLKRIFEEKELKRIIDYIEKNKIDLDAEISDEVYYRMKEENEILKKSYENSSQKFNIRKKRMLVIPK